MAFVVLVFYWYGPARAEIDVVITSGLVSPDGNGTLTFPNAPALNNAGDMSFVSQLTGTSGGNIDNSGLFRHDSAGLAIIARRGQPLIDRTITFLLSSSIDSTGKVTGIPALSGPPAVWYLQGDGGPIASPFTLGSPSPSGNNTLLGVLTTAVNDGGVMAFRAVYNGASPEAGIYERAADGTITTRLLQQTPAPRGGTINGMGNRLMINESADVAALLTIDSELQSVARVGSSGVQELARPGDMTTDGTTAIAKFTSATTFTTSPIPVINDAGQIAFTGETTVPAFQLGVFLADDAGIRLLTPTGLPGAPAAANTMNVVGLSNTGSAAVLADFGFGADPTSGIYSASEEGASLVALEDTATPVAGKYFRSFFTGAISSNASGQIAFLAELSDTVNGPAAGRGLYFYDPAQGLQEIVRTGDSLAGSTVTSLFFNGTFLDAISSQSPDTSVSGFNNEGQLAFAFGLANGESGLGLWSAPATPGDFDFDGDVDGRDFLLWQRNPHTGDLADWQANYGASSQASQLTLPPPAEPGSPVPEPGCAMLVGIAIIILGRVRAER